MRKLNLMALMALLLLLLPLWSCSSGGDDGATTPPPLGGNPGGDPDEDTPPGTGGNFAPAGGYVGLRGVAVAREFVYVADENIVYCFDKSGALVNQVTALETVQGISIFPSVLAEEVENTSAYFLANCPVVLHNPVGAWGYATIYPPGLDPAATREDVGNPDARRIDGLPPDPDLIDPPGTCAQTTCYQCTNVYDIKVDRYGSVIITLDVNICCNPLSAPPTPDFPRTLQVLSGFDDLHIQTGGLIQLEFGPNGELVDTEIPGYHRTFNFPFGDFDYISDTNDITPEDFVNTGAIAVDRLYPPFVESSSYQLYLGSANFLRDYVGVAGIDVDPAGLLPLYGTSAPIENGYGYDRIVGGPGGAAPGSFSPYPNNADPDLTNGGPAGLCVDPRTDDLYVCDPGNSRVQIFDSAGRLKDILTSASGVNLVAPSEVAVDYDGNVYICDVDTLRILRRTPPDIGFGGIGGSVRNAILDTELPGAVVELRSSNGTIFETEISNINGQYRFENLPIGNYFVGASKFNYVSDFPEQPIQVIRDQTVTANFNLEPLTGVTTGTYVGVVSDSVSKLLIEFTTVSVVGTSLTTQTDITGRFDIADIPPGTYQVLFTKDGYETVTKDVTILRGDTTIDNHIQLTPIL